MTATRRLSPLLVCAALAGLFTYCSDGPSTLEVDPALGNIAPGQDERAVRLRIAGYLDGYLEPCGCAKAQMGGLARRIFNLKRNSDFDLLIEGGNLVHGGTELDGHKLVTTFEVLSMVQPHAVAIGPKDLSLGETLLERLNYFPDFPFISADLRAKDGVEWPVATHVDKKVGDHNVRIAGLTLSRPDSLKAKLDLVAPDAAWSDAMQGLDADALRVLCAHGEADRIRGLADSLKPRPDLVVGMTSTVADPPSQWDQTSGGVPIVWPGTGGRMMLDVMLRRMDGGSRITRYKVIRLKGSETAKGALEDEGAKMTIRGHRDLVAQSGTLENMANQLPTKNNWTYVGSEACGECHDETHESWLTTAHAKAWQTLVDAEKDPERYGWPVTKYPDCVACHVVGYREKSGFINPEKTKELLDVGCEACHGPGSEHVDKQTPETIYRSGPADCVRCHDREQSPDFDYLKLWQKIKH